MIHGHMVQKGTGSSARNRFWQWPGFALVLDTHENLLLAERTLRLLARLLLDHLRLLTPGTNFLLRADRIEGILTRFLPHGQLLFLNDQFVQDLEKEFSAAWPR